MKRIVTAAAVLAAAMGVQAAGFDWGAAAQGWSCAENPRGCRDWPREYEPQGQDAYLVRIENRQTVTGDRVWACVYQINGYEVATLMPPSGNCRSTIRVR